MITIKLPNCDWNYASENGPTRGLASHRENEHAIYDGSRSKRCCRAGASRQAHLGRPI